MNRATSIFLPPTWLKLVLTGLVVLLVLLSILIVTAITVLRSSPARLEVVLEAVVSRVLNRELQIGELLEAELGWDSYLLARDVTLANPAWADEPDFARVGRFLIRINLPSIWRDGPILISELELTDASVSLLAPENHPPTWNFWPDNVDDDLPETRGSSREQRQPIFPVRIHRGRIGKGAIVYRDAERDVALSIEELSLQEAGDNAQIDLSLFGIINEIPLKIKGKLGPTAALLTWRDIKIDLAASLGKLELQARGTIKDLENFSGPDLHLSISSPHSRPLMDMLGMSEIRDGPLRFEGHITDAHPGLAVKIVGALEEFHIQISGELANPMAIDGVDIVFKIDGPSMAEAGAFFNLQGLPELPYEVSGEIKRYGKDLTLNKGVFTSGEGRLTVEGRLPNFPGIDDWELDIASDSFNLEMLGPLVGAEGLPAIPYNIHGSLSATEEGVELVDLRIRSPESSLLLNGVVGEAPDYLGSRIEVELQGADMAAAGLWLGLHDLPNLEYRVSGEVLLSDTGWRLSDGLLITQGLRLGVNAHVDKLPAPTAITATLDLDSENFEASVAAFGLESEGLPALPLAINGKLSGSPGNIKIDGMTANLGETQIKVSGVMGDPTTFSGLDLHVSFSSPDLLKVFPDINDDTLPQIPVNTRSHITLSDDGLGIEDFQGKFANVTIALSGLYNIAPHHKNSHFTLEADGPDLNRVLGPWLKQKIAKKPFQLSLDVGLRAGGLQLERFEASVEGVQLSAQLDIDNLQELTSAQGKIEISGASSLQLAQLLGSDLDIPDADFSLTMGIKKSPDGLQLDPIVLQWGKTDIVGTVDYRPGDVPVIKADLYSKYVSLPFLLPDIKTLESEEEARVKEGNTKSAPMRSEKLSKKEAAEKVIPDDPLNFSWLRRVQGAIKYRVDEVYLKEDTKSSAVIDISLANGVLTSRQLHWDGTFLSGDAELTIRALDKGAEIDGYLDARRIPLLLLLGGQPKYDPDAFYRLRIKTAGGSLREMANNADGALVFSGGGGQMDNKGLDLIMGDTLEELFDRLNPFRETDLYTKVICHAGAMSFKDGKVMADPGFVLRTKKIDIASGGSIVLQNEKLDLGFSNRSRKGIGISAGNAITPYFKIGGTLANPRLVLDPKGVALSGGAAVATAGLSILAEGLWDRWIATASNPCEKLIDKIAKEKNGVYRALLEAPSRQQ